MKRAILVLFTLVILVAAVTTPAFAKVCSVGDKASVLWKGKWYPAVVKNANKSKCYIHYNGYGSKWDEWVGSDRIKITHRAAPLYPVGHSVSVKWKGKWYPAKVIAVGNNTWKVHYNGYGSKWDEWVGKSRIK